MRIKSKCNVRKVFYSLLKIFWFQKGVKKSSKIKKLLKMGLSLN